MVLKNNNQDGIKSLKDVVQSEQASYMPVKVLVGNNCGTTTLLFPMDMATFHSRSIVASGLNAEGAVAQRVLDNIHAQGLAKYFLIGLVKARIKKKEENGEKVEPFLRRMESILGSRPYVAIQPVVCNVRDESIGLARIKEVKDSDDNVVAYIYYLPLSKLLYVIDGQHRKKGIDLLFFFLNEVIQNRRFPKKSLNLLESLSGEVTDEMAEVFRECHKETYNCTIQIECHMGADIIQERQAFHDLNNLGKSVDSNISMEFDSANPINKFLKEKLVSNDSAFLWASDESQPDEEPDHNVISIKDLGVISALLFINKTTPNNANPSQVDAMMDIALRFWEAIDTIEDLDDPNARDYTVAAQPVVLKALAKTAYMLSNGKTADEEQLEKFLDGISEIDFSHENPLWRYFNLTDEERESEGLEGVRKFLAEGTEGKFAAKLLSAWNPELEQVKYATAHNDIYPVLGDLIRYTLDLPSREHRASSQPPRKRVRIRRT